MYNIWYWAYAGHEVDHVIALQSRFSKIWVEYIHIDQPFFSTREEAEIALPNETKKLKKKLDDANEDEQNHVQNNYGTPTTHYKAWGWRP